MPKTRSPSQAAPDIIPTVEINNPAADFALPDLNGKIHRLRDNSGKIVLVNFWSAECPHSERTDQHLLNLLKRWKGEVILLSIAANRNEFPQLIAEAAQTRRIPIVLLDGQAAVADLYGAVTTPHVFVVDRDGILRYRGAVDNVTFRQREATQLYLEDAVTALLDGRLPEIPETLSYGCTIVREI